VLQTGWVSAFDDDTMVGEDGSARIVDGWDIAGNANGGYLLALAANGLRAISGRADPISVTAHYLAPGTPGMVQIAGSVIKPGKRFTTVEGAMRRDGRPILQLLGAFGDVDHDPGGFEHYATGPPELPPIEDCPLRTAADSPVPVPLLQHLDVRICDTGVRGEIAGWLAFSDGRPLDTLALLLVCDAFPPAAFSILPVVGWVPTIEFTVHVRGRPAPGPVRCRFRTRFVRHGYFEEDGEVWDSAGQLVAISRQLGITPR
jgi:acyl-CoA thioesterase